MDRKDVFEYVKTIWNSTGISWKNPRSAVLRHKTEWYAVLMQVKNLKVRTRRRGHGRYY